VQVHRLLPELGDVEEHLDVAVDVAEADVFVDGAPMGRSPLASALLLDAGDHHVEVQKRGYESARSSVTLGTGETRRIALHLEEIKARVVEAPRALSTPATPLARRSSAPLWLAWSGTGALAAGAGVTGWLASREARKLESQVASPGSTADERRATKDDAARLAVVSDVLTATAVAAGAIALYLSLRPGPAGSAPKDAKVAVGVCGTGACAAGRF
ncbi:PEGA domain-containing protein, partial [bacterium]